MFGIFKNKEKKVVGSQNSTPKYYTLTVKEVIAVTKDAVNLVFEKPFEQFIYEPGQFLTIIRTIGGKKVRRAYSLCTAPEVDEYPAVTVKRVEGGIMSNHLNDHVQAGDQIEVMEPMGMFTSDYQPGRSRHMVLIAGGSGITPLMSILKAVLNREPNSKVSLVFANRSEDSIIFKKTLADFENQYADRLQLIHILEKSPENWDGYIGRLEIEKLKNILSALPQMPAEATEYYTCGPGPMMDIVVDTLNVMGVAPDCINKESFEARATSPTEVVSDTVTASTGKRQVKIILDGDEYSFSVSADKTILEAGLEADIDMPYSCQSGLCTACRGKCVSGKVSTEDAEGLSRSELDEGYVLTCVGKPLSVAVTIEIG